MERFSILMTSSLISLESIFIQFKSHSMSELPLSDLGFKDKMAWIFLTLESL